MLVPPGPPLTQMAHQPAGGPIAISSEQMAKLRSELDIVQQNCKVFGEMLTESTPGQEESDDWQLMQVL